MQFSDVIGLLGVAIILITYFLLQPNRLQLEQMLYSLLNLFGVILIFISLLFDWNLAAFIIKVSWILICLYGIYKSIKNRRIS